MARLSATKQPDGCARRSLGAVGANHFRYSEILSSPEIKNISLYQKAKSVLHSAHPALLRRASAVVTDVGRGAMDAGLRCDDGVNLAYGKSVWSWRPTPVSSRRTVKS